MSRRLERIARMIKEETARVLLHDLSDPRMGFITVTSVKVSGDLSHALISVSVMGTEAQKRTCLQGLTGARGFVQNAVAGVLHTRTTPRIQFKLDESIDKAIEFADLLKQVREEYGTEDPESQIENQE